MKNTNNRISKMLLDDTTISKLDIVKYMGIWYEIARYPNNFENGLSNISAEYSLKSNGKIQVINSGIKNGKFKNIKGKAKQPNSKEPGKLKVSFFLWFYGDYNIIYLDNDYKYAIITGKSNKYLWILSRNKIVPHKELNILLNILVTKGFSISRLIYVNQK